MGVYAGPDVSESGLVLALDAGNTKSYDKRENLVSYSTYNASTWSNIFPAGATLTTGISAPDGTNTAVRFTCNNTTNALLRVSFPAFTPNGTDTYTTSFYVRKISGTTALGNQLTTDLNDGDPSGNYINQLVTNTWVRVSFSGVPTATSKAFIDLLSDRTTDYVLDFWGVQVEKASSVTDYTATSGSTISRGTTWTDITRRGNNGSLGIGTTTAPTYSSSNNGVLVFDGVNDYVDGTISISNANVSVSCWVNIATTSNKGAFAFIGGSYAIGVGSVDYDTLGNNIVALYSNVRWINTGVTYGTGWKYVTMVLDASSVPTIYVNASLIGSYSGNSPGATTGVYRIGRNFGDEPSGPRAFNGNIAQVQIYNRALTAAEIKQNYNATKGRYGL